MISSTINRINYTGNGVLDTYPYTFKILADTDLLVYVSAAPQTVDVHYTVTGVGETGGGNVVFGASYIPALDASIVIIRNLPTTQKVDYTAGGRFPAETHEVALDRQTMVAQRLLEKLGRVPMISEVLGLSGIELAPPGAGLYLRWNVAGDGIDAIAAVQDLGNFTQSGVGAVARTAISKIGEILSITDFAGVDPTGALDSTAGITAAYTAASGIPVRWPSGIYKTTSTLTLPTDSITISDNAKIDGAYGGILVSMGNRAKILGHLEIDGNDVAGSIGIQYGPGDVYYSHIESVDIHHCASIGQYLYSDSSAGVYFNTGNVVRISDCGTGVKFYTSTGAVKVDSNHFGFVSIQDCTTPVTVDAAYGIGFNRLDFVEFRPW